MFEFNFVVTMDYLDVVLTKIDSIRSKYPNAKFSIEVLES